MNVGNPVNGSVGNDFLVSNGLPGIPAGRKSVVRRKYDGKISPLYRKSLGVFLALFASYAIKSSETARL
jgi:hypothetical protein